MNNGSQTLRELVTRTDSLVHPRTQMRIACWHVRTMYAPGKVLEVDRVMEDLKIDVLGMSECRWSGSGKLG